jgi:hypothetical protein
MLPKSMKNLLGIGLIILFSLTGGALAKGGNNDLFSGGSNSEEKSAASYTATTNPSQISLPLQGPQKLLTSSRIT